MIFDGGDPALKPTEISALLYDKKDYDENGFQADELGLEYGKALSFSWERSYKKAATRAIKKLSRTIDHCKR